MPISAGFDLAEICSLRHDGTHRSLVKSTAPLSKSKILGITLGDPGGIGAEVALKAVHARGVAPGAKLVLIGHASLAESIAQRLRLPMPATIARLPEDAAERRRLSRVSLWQPEAPSGAPDRLAWQSGLVCRRYGRLAAAWVAAAARACLAGGLDGMVTAPLCKQSLALAGVPFPGHTEYLAELTGAKNIAMMLLGGPLRVVLATRHLPLAQVPRALTGAGIIAAARLAAAAIAWLDAGKIRQPGPLAVCALNPHAGDGGVLGNEEIRIIRPAIRRLRRLGLDVAGPIPADAVFYQAARGHYGAVLAMYHDQGLGPLKTLAFDTGVNLTLGLPIVRTSPDHGTAFDIAGRGIADPRSMQAAIALANDLARRPNPWRRATS